MKKLILNCDTGIDDAFAIAYAVGQKQMELIGVTASYGVSHVGNAYRNSKYILNLLKSPKEVFRGSEKPLERPMRNYMEAESVFHGGDGLANTLGQYTEADIAGTSSDDGIEFIIDSIHKYRKELVLVTTGPLTDLAKVLQRDPSVKDKIGMVVSMAGALATPGNVSMFAEVNALMDPEAAKIVLEADLPLTLVGLDITRKTLFTGWDLERWRGIKTSSAEFFACCAQHYLNAYNAKHPYLHGCALHDPLAVGAALHPEWVTAVPMRLTCELKGEAAGRICENLELSNNNDPGRTLGAMRVNKTAFENEFFSVVEQAFRYN